MTSSTLSLEPIYLLNRLPLTPASNWREEAERWAVSAVRRCGGRASRAGRPGLVQGEDDVGT